MSCVLLQYGTDQDRRTKHEFITDVPGLLILPPIHYQGALDGVVLAGDAPRQGVDVRHHAIAEFVVA